jgi:hypothetical protein
MDKKFDTGMDNAGFPNKANAAVSPGKAPKAGTTHSAEKAGVESGLSERMDCNSDPSANGMNTEGKDQKPQANPRDSVSKNGNNFEFC